MTAEFAVVVPAVLIVLLLVLGGFQLVVQQILLADAAGSAVRLAARGDDPGAALGQLAPGASAAIARDGAFVCVELAAGSNFTPAALIGMTISARACALADAE